MYVQHAARPRAQLCSFGSRYDIEVPSTEARDLACYLLAHRVPDGPPEPFLPDIDRIELHGDLSTASVQSLLCGWQ